MESAVQVERAGINLKPSGRMSEPVSLQAPIEPGKTVGNIAVDDPIFSCRDVDVYLRRETRHQEGGHRHRARTRCSR